MNLHAQNVESIRRSDGSLLGPLHASKVTLTIARDMPPLALAAHKQLQELLTFPLLSTMTGIQIRDPHSG